MISGNHEGWSGVILSPLGWFIMNSANHFPPGHQGAPDCLWPHHPVHIPGPPLTNDISGSSPSNQSFSISGPIVFGALSDGMNPISWFRREPLRSLSISENHEKSWKNDVRTSIRDASGDVWESLGMLSSDPECSRMISGDFRKSWFSWISNDF